MLLSNNMYDSERSAIKNIDNEQRSDVIEKAAAILLPMYPSVHRYMEQVAIQPGSLGDYDENIVKRDVAYAQELRSKMSKTDEARSFGKFSAEDAKKLADILEYQIYLGINKHNWIPFCRAIKTSDYDDIVNGVDMVVEYNNNESFGHLGLGVDVSFSKNLDKKFLRIKNEIDNFDGNNNRLAEIKYFKSERSGISGRLFGIPRVVAALDLGVMQDLTKRMDHVASHSIIIEMQHQLETFKAYAMRTNSGCVPQLERASAFMTVISQKLESEQKLEMSEYGKNRQIQEAIEQGLKIFQ